MRSKAAVNPFLYIPLQIASSKLQKYGYAQLETVFYAFRVEIDLVRLMRLSGTTQTNVALSYKNYFNVCLDDITPGSLANALASVSSAMTKLEQEYFAGDKGLIGPWHFRDRERTVCTGSPRNGRECNTVWDQHRLHPQMTITGSLSEGFSYQVNDVNQIYADSSQPAGAYLSSRQAVLDTAREWVRTQVMPTYDEKSRQYRILRGQKETLIRLREKCVQFRDIAASYS